MTDIEAAKAKFRSELPHLYGFKHFKWSREFWESTNRYTFLTMSNQSGKSIISIRKAIRMATDIDFQRRCFKTTASYGVYFYPALKLATREFKQKWVKEVLPRGDMKDDPKYGWTSEDKDGEIYAVHFKNGFTIYFFSYNQKVGDMQAMSPSFISADEEMPSNLWGEISARLMASKGLFSLVCTPTLGEELWRKVFELNFMPNAKVIKATMYDTIKFEDGSAGLRTVAEIEDFKAKLPTPRDVAIRVYGKFAKAEGLVYPTFDIDRTIVPPLAEAQTWPCYAGIDIGSGGTGHPAAICFVAVRPDFKQARVVKSWCGNSSETTTSVDILRKYQQMKVGLHVIAAFYDYSSREFGLQALADNELVMPAEKSHDISESLLNVLFKHGMLLFEESDEALAMSGEIQTLKIGEKKQNAKDDRIDSLRYAVVRIPFDTSHVGAATEVKKAVVKIDPNDRTQYQTENLNKNVFSDHIEQEIEYWNSLHSD